MEFRIDRIRRLEDTAPLRPLISNYFEWVVPLFNAQNGLDSNPEEAERRTLAGLEAFLPPKGVIACAQAADGSAVGMGFLRRIRPDAGELKRLYVSPAARGSGLGRALVRHLIEAAHEMRIAALYLDTTAFMHSAHRLYRAEGFEDIAPYPESEHPPEQAEHVLYMMRRLE